MQELSPLLSTSASREKRTLSSIFKFHGAAFYMQVDSNAVSLKLLAEDAYHDEELHNSDHL